MLNAHVSSATALFFLMLSSVLVIGEGFMRCAVLDPQQPTFSGVALEGLFAVVDFSKPSNARKLTSASSSHVSFVPFEGLVSLFP